MMPDKTKKLVNSRLSRFLSVGVLNTALDFAILNALLITFGHGSNQRVIVFNTISATSVAGLSFVLNRAFVFKSKHTPHHYALYFIGITLAGLYIVQNAIMYAFLHWLHGPADWLADVIQSIGLSGINKDFILVNSAKVFGTLGSLVWNYSWYKRVIFKPPTSQE